MRGGGNLRCGTRLSSPGSWGRPRRNPKVAVTSPRVFSGGGGPLDFINHKKIMAKEEDEDPTDIFDTSFSSLFSIAPIAFSTSSPDALHIYTPPNPDLSPSIELKLPHPPPELYTKLQANNLWLAAVYLSDVISNDQISLGRRVCELGAGAGLPGIVAGRKGCKVVSTDWGVDEVLNVIRDNFHRAKIGDYRVVGHMWGTDPTPLLQAFDDTSDNHDQDQRFDSLILADTLWVTEAQSALLDSVFALLKPEGIAHIAAGIHTGRGPLKRFVTAAENRGATITKVKEVRWNQGQWDVYDRPKGQGDERGVVVYYTCSSLTH